MILLIHLPVIFLNLPNYTISHLNSSSDLIKILRIPRKYLSSPWILPLFNCVLSNSLLFIKIGEFITCFSISPRVFNDHVDLSHQLSPLIDGSLIITNWCKIHSIMTEKLEKFKSFLHVYFGQYFHRMLHFLSYF